MTVRILIVEDEISSREGLTQLIENSDMDVEILTSENGYDGYKKALSYRPQIIISDIRMPMWDGLTMVEHLKKSSISAKIILLTGYAEFSYAQKAIELGISDYILKPVSPHEIIQKLSDIISSLHTDSLQINFQGCNRLHLNVDDDLPVFRNAIETKGYVRYLTGLIYLGDQEHLNSDVKNFFSKYSDTYLVYLPDSRFRGVIIGIKDEDHYSFKMSFSHLQTTIIEKTRLIMIYQVIGTDNPVNWLDQFKKLSSCISWSITLNSRCFEFQSSMNDGNSEQLSLAHYKKNLQKAYSSQNYQLCCSVIKKQLDKMREDGICPHQIILTVSSSIRNIYNDTLYYSVLQEINSALTYEELSLAIDKYFSHSIESSEKASGPYSKFVQGAIDRIEKNYSGMVSLSIVAESLSITPPYLSRLFLQETGKNFIDYLIEYRITKAKELLSNSKLCINDISKQVGYPDPQYFCTIFRKKTGITPNQFRKNSRA